MITLENLIKRLQMVKGKGTTLVSLYVPGTLTQITKANRLIAEEYGTARNIKSSVTRHAVMSALNGVQQQLKSFIRKVPENGIVIFCGESISEVIYAPKSVRNLVYRCDSHFHLESLKEMIQDDGVDYGFIILDGKEALFATVNGSHGKKVLLKYYVDLPSKHGRGGQSANRFARQRV